MNKCHVITGATGLIASSLMLRLAEETDDEMICLLRPGGEDPQERLHTALQRTAFDTLTSSETVAAAQARSRIVPFDLRADQPPPTTAFPCRGTSVEFWHSAALMNFHPKAREESFATNVEGTQRVADLARRFGPVAFNYFSTAYVAGYHAGTAREESVQVPNPRNGYEASKIAAERYLREDSGLPVRILRPGIVVGHSTTLRYPGTANGPFLAQRIFAQHFQTGDHARATQRPRVLARGKEPINLVPVDQVTREALHISRTGPTSGTFHLTNAAPPTVRDMLHAFLSNAGSRPPELTLDEDELTADDRLLQRRIGVLSPYLDNPQDFDRSNTDAALPAGSPTGWQADIPTLSRLFRPFAHN